MKAFLRPPAPPCGVVHGVVLRLDFNCKSMDLKENKWIVIENQSILTENQWNLIKNQSVLIENPIDFNGQSMNFN